MFYSDAHQELNENKIFIYDDLMMNHSSIESYTSDEFADPRSRSLLRESDNESLDANKITGAAYPMPLFTIEEGGSSVSSGSNSLASLMNGVSHTKCFLTGNQSEINLINQASTLPNPLHQYLQTCTSNNSRGKDNIVFEIPPFNKTSKTPIPGLGGKNMTYGGGSAGGT
jgi:hypothetical protein